MDPLNRKPKPLEDKQEIPGLAEVSTKLLIIICRSTIKYSLFIIRLLSHCEKNYINETLSFSKQIVIAITCSPTGVIEPN